MDFKSLREGAIWSDGKGHSGATAEWLQSLWKWPLKSKRPMWPEPGVTPFTQLLVFHTILGGRDAEALNMNASLQ